MSVFESLFKYPLEEFANGEIVFTSAWPVEVRLLVAGVFAAAGWWLYRQVAGRASGWRRGALLGLRWAALAIVLFMLGLPGLRSRKPPKPGQENSFVAVMFDTSRSMSIADAAGAAEEKVPRIEAARALMEGEKGLAERLRRHAGVLYYGFDAGARRMTKPEYATNGRESNFFRSLRDLAQDVRTLPMAGAVMLTDGCHNSGGTARDGAQLLAAEGIPLFAVGLGSLKPPRDYDVALVIAPNRVRRNTDVEVRAIVRHTDYPGPFTAQILLGNTVVKQQRVDPRADSDMEDVRINFSPEHKGTATYRLRVPAGVDEQVTENNEREFAIDIADDRLPVLYVEGSPRFEYRFLRHAVSRDKDFRVVGMLRLKTGRVYLQGADDKEKATRDGQTERQFLAAGFPDTAEKLNRFQALILGDIEAKHFTAAQQALIRDFVTERGGGLLMLGGVNGFGLGGYAGTPVGDLLPVAITARDGEYAEQTFKPVFAESGLRHPVMRLVEDRIANLQLWREMPDLLGLTPVGEIKPGAALLITRAEEGDGQALPVLAVQRAGNGRVAAFMSGGSWHWQMSRPAKDEFHEKFWKQMIRWLAVGAREQLSVALDKRVCNGIAPVLIEATVMDRNLEPASDAEPVATVTDPLNNEEKLPLEWTLAREGVYQAQYTPALKGQYAVSVELAGARWENVKPARTGFEVVESVIEFNNAGLKEDLLKEMAAITGGQYVAPTPEGVEEIAAGIARLLEAARLAAAARKTKPLWDMPALFIAILALMGAEWFVRRRGELS